MLPPPPQKKKMAFIHRWSTSHSAGGRRGTAAPRCSAASWLICRPPSQALSASRRSPARAWPTLVDAKALIVNGVEPFSRIKQRRSIERALRSTSASALPGGRPSSGAGAWVRPGGPDSTAAHPPGAGHPPLLLPPPPSQGFQRVAGSAGSSISGRAALPPTGQRCGTFCC